MCTGLTLEQFGTHAKELEPTIMRSQGMWNYCGHDGILLAPNPQRLHFSCRYYYQYRQVSCSIEYL